MADAVRAEKLKIELATEHLVKTSSFPLMLLHIFLKKKKKEVFPEHILHLFLQWSLNSWIWDIEEVHEVQHIKSIFSMRVLILILHFDAV